MLATGFGKLVPPRDPVALRAAVLEMARLPAEDREAGREAATKLFGGETSLDAHEEAFARLRGRP
nr:hypothetical protein GCM10017745_42810 [Saccharothrix mutabilis subsp. capreolus]